MRTRSPVAGASKGIGLATTRTLLAAGARVVDRAVQAFAQSAPRSQAVVNVSSGHARQQSAINVDYGATSLPVVLVVDAGWLKAV